MIYYLSGTGNTRWAVEQIAKATGDRVACMADLPSGPVALRLEPGERLGFCFPVHGWRPPLLVRHFIERLETETAGHYVYALCTAGDTIGETIDILRQDLSHRHIQLDAAYSLLMPESYVGLPFMDVDNPQNEQRKIDEAAKLMTQYATEIANRKPGGGVLHTGRWPRINSRIIGSVFVRKLVSDRPFHVDSTRCVKCGICADVCPVHDIDGGLGHEPRWTHNGRCMTCFACYHHCPHHAIDFGKQTQRKGQYFMNHPPRRNSGGTTSS